MHYDYDISALQAMKNNSIRWVLLLGIVVAQLLATNVFAAERTVNLVVAYKNG